VLPVLDTPPVQAPAEARMFDASSVVALLCGSQLVPRHAVARQAQDRLEETLSPGGGTMPTLGDARAHVPGHGDVDVYHRRRRRYAE
jgi:hypothetical protein